MKTYFIKASPGYLVGFNPKTSISHWRQSTKTALRFSKKDGEILITCLKDIWSKDENFQLEEAK